MAPENDEAPSASEDGMVVKIKECGRANGRPSSGSLDCERGGGERDGVEGVGDGGVGEGRGEGKEGGKGKVEGEDEEEEREWVSRERRCSVDYLMM